MLKVKADLFLFLPDFLFFLPLGRGETSSSKEGLQAEGSSEIQRSRVLASTQPSPDPCIFRSTLHDSSFRGSFLSASFFFHLVDTFHQFESQISDKQPRLQSWSRIHTGHRCVTAFRLILTHTAANVPDESIPSEQPGPEPNTAREENFY